MARNMRRRILPVVENTENTEDSDIDSVSLCSFSSCSESDFGLDLLFTIFHLKLVVIGLNLEFSVSATPM